MIRFIGILLVALMGAACGYFWGISGFVSCEQLHFRLNKIVRVCPLLEEAHEHYTF